MPLYQELIVYGADDAKTCRTCERAYPAAAEGFARDRTKADGFCSQCRRCRAEYKRRLHETDPTANAARMRERYARDPEKERAQKRRDYEKHRETRKAACREYRERNLEKARAACRERHRRCDKARRRVLQLQYYHANRDRFREAMNAAARACRARDPEKHREKEREARRLRPEVTKARDHRRRARRRAAEGTVTDREIRVLLAASQGRCFWCDKQLGEKYELDHLHALAKGGSNWPWNIVISCRPCNKSKSDQFAIEWGPRHWRRIQRESQAVA